MQEFTVEGAPKRFGPGTVLGLSAAQYAPRAHNCDRLEVQPDDGRYVAVRARTGLDFKVGESLFIEGEPNKALVDTLIDAVEAEAEPPPVKAAPKKGRAK